MANHEPISPSSATELALLERYGELMDSTALAEFFKFPHERALGRATSKAGLPVPVFRLTGRNGWFARTRDVAAWLTQLSPPPP